MIICQLSRLGAEAEVRCLRQFDLFSLETFGPLVHSFVLEIDSEGGFCVVGQPNLRGNGAAGAEASCLIRCQSPRPYPRSRAMAYY